ncbi:MAG: hypothetical protein U1U88_000544 [Lawsonella clevelandensis]
MLSICQPIPTCQSPAMTRVMAATVAITVKAAGKIRRIRRVQKYFSEMRPVLARSRMSSDVMRNRTGRRTHRRPENPRER